MSLNPRVTTTPKEISGRILEFCKQLDSTQTPLFLAPTNLREAMVGDCYLNAATKVKSDGGTVQHGWIIWENPGRLLEAEFHAVWKSPDERLHDVTPPKDGEQQILFMPDSKKVWQRKMVPNVRIALDDLQETKEFLEYATVFDTLKMRYYNAAERRYQIPAKLSSKTLSPSMRGRQHEQGAIKWHRKLWTPF